MLDFVLKSYVVDPAYFYIALNYASTLFKHSMSYISNLAVLDVVFFVKWFIPKHEKDH